MSRESLAIASTTVVSPVTIAIAVLLAVVFKFFDIESPPAALNDWTDWVVKVAGISVVPSVAVALGGFGVRHLYGRTQRQQRDAHSD